MLEEIAEGISEFKNSITVSISENIPQPIINEYRIVKRGTRGTLTNNDINIVNGSVDNKHDMLDSYKNLTMAIFKREGNFVRYLKKDYIFNLEPIRK